jgi:hypothetical protein
MAMENRLRSARRRIVISDEAEWYGGGFGWIVISEHDGNKLRA